MRNADKSPKIRYSAMMKKWKSDPGSVYPGLDRHQKLEGQAGVSKRTLEGQ